MDDPVARVLAERESLDAGFPGSVVLSIVAHLLLVGGAMAAPFVFPAAPVLKVMDGFAVPLPRGGGGPVAPAAPPSAAPAAKPAEPEAEAPAPAVTKVLQPPKDLRQGLPELDSKKSRRKAEPQNPQTADAKPSGAQRAASGPDQAVGLAIGPPGVGVPEGTDSGGDWYIASVIQKIRAIWLQQLTTTSMQQPAVVSVTIQADGSVTGVAVVGSSGVFTADQAAQRAIYSAAPFRELPKTHGTALTIQLRFLPPAR
jgi:TonB family protein